MYKLSCICDPVPKPGVCCIKSVHFVIGLIKRKIDFQDAGILALYKYITGVNHTNY